MIDEVEKLETFSFPPVSSLCFKRKTRRKARSKTLYNFQTTIYFFSSCLHFLQHIVKYIYICIYKFARHVQRNIYYTQLHICEDLPSRQLLSYRETYTWVPKIFTPFTSLRLFSFFSFQS